MKKNRLRKAIGMILEQKGIPITQTHVSSMEETFDLLWSFDHAKALAESDPPDERRLNYDCRLLACLERCADMLEPKK